MAFSCRATSTPSLVMTRSGSMMSAPSSMAFWYAANVCSGRSAEAPRWAMTVGVGGQAWATAPSAQVVNSAAAVTARSAMRFMRVSYKRSPHLSRSG